jgi:hypothetical protein
MHKKPHNLSNYTMALPDEHDDFLMFLKLAV